MYYIHTDTATSKREVELHSQSDKTLQLLLEEMKSMKQEQLLQLESLMNEIYMKAVKQTKKK